MHESTGSAARALDLLSCLVSVPSLAAAAKVLELPMSTAHRLAALLVERGFLIRSDRGEYLPGRALIAIAGKVDLRATLAGVARPILRRFARKTKATIHLGILEGEMVTYLVKEEGGGSPLFTRQGMQLEAYCSAIGKLLLADLPQGDLDVYLAGGPFIPLTNSTLAESSALRAHLAAVREQGYAMDDREVADDLICIGVPIRDPEGRVIAAVSRSASPPAPPIETTLRQLRGCVDEIERRLFGVCSQAPVMNVAPQR